MQGANELVELMGSAQDRGGGGGGGGSGGGAESFRAVADACFAFGAFSSSMLAYFVYENVGVEWVLYIAAIVVGGYYAAFAALVPVWSTWGDGGDDDSSKEARGDAAAANCAVVPAQKLVQALTLTQ